MSITEAPTAPSVLAGYVEQREFARATGVTSRTIARYREQADGLPWLAFGGKVYIPVAEARAWLARRVQHPNKRREVA